MKRLVLCISAVVLGIACIWSARPHVTHAAGGTDVWKVGPNCQGVTNTAQHICEFGRTQLHVAGDGTPYDQWDIIVVEPNPVTSVSCELLAPNLIPFKAAFGGSNASPWAGSHYGNVGICRGWINGGNGPVQITATY
jgi:hypothetical protein